MGGDRVLPDTASPLLEMKGVNKQFPGVTALKDVSLSIRHGEIYGLVGENGAGKSTLIKIFRAPIRPIVARLRSPERRSVAQRPHACSSSASRSSIRRRCSRRISAWLRNLSLGRLPKTRWRTVDWPQATSRSKNIMARLGFEVDPLARVGSLSVAQRQMVEIAGALSRERAHRGARRALSRARRSGAGKALRDHPAARGRRRKLHLYLAPAAGGVRHLRSRDCAARRRGRGTRAIDEVDPRR